MSGHPHKRPKSTVFDCIYTAYHTIIPYYNMSIYHIYNQFMPDLYGALGLGLECIIHDAQNFKLDIIH